MNRNSSRVAGRVTFGIPSKSMMRQCMDLSPMPCLRSALNNSQMAITNASGAARHISETAPSVPAPAPSLILALFDKTVRRSISGGRRPSRRRFAITELSNPNRNACTSEVFVGLPYRLWHNFMAPADHACRDAVLQPGCTSIIAGWHLKGFFTALSADKSRRT